MSIALILVDIQYDFLPGGALAVTDGDQIIPIVNALQAKVDLVVATQDWHPADHGSFAANHPGTTPGQVIDLHGLPQVLWPVHCVQGSEGADFHHSLDMTHTEKIFHKGVDPTIDSYSGFYDNGHRRSTGLAAYLKEKGVDQVWVVGLATDYCVKFTALDAVAEGFQTSVVTDATKAVNLQPEDGVQALAEMEAAGITLITSGALR